MLSSGVARYIPLDFEALPENEMSDRARRFRTRMEKRRTTRDFSTRPVPRELIEEAVRTASSAPSGANLQPWTFVAVGGTELKQQIREAAEAEERKNYDGRMNDAWREALEHLGTDADKPHITDAPWVVVMFKHTTREVAGEKMPMYYASESAGIAAGMFIAAVHNMGLVTLTHTPSPMGFLGQILGRPAHEKAFLLMPVGYPAEGAEVPDISRKSIDEVLFWR